MALILDELKTCNKCKIAKPFTDFGKQLNGKFGLRGRCKVCITRPSKEKANAIAKKWRDNNRELLRERSRERYHADPEKANRFTMESRRRHYDTYIEYSRSYESKNKEQRLLKSRLYAKNNPHKYAEMAMQRRIGQKTRTPLWANKEAIKNIYLERDRLNEEAGYIKYHVDHIIPLLAKEASGLHVEGNLQIVLASYNVSKRNKIMEDTSWL